MLSPVFRPGQHHGADRVNHRYGVAVDVIVRLGLGFAYHHAVVPSPLGQIALFQNADEQVPQLIGGAVPHPSQVLTRRGGNGRQVVGIHGEIVGLDAGDMMLFGNGIIQAAEVGAHHGVRAVAGVVQVVQQHRRHIPEGLFQLSQETHAVHAWLHHVAHDLHRVAGKLVVIQPRIANHLFKARKGGDGNLMSTVFQFAPQQHIRTHIPCGANGQHGDFHGILPILQPQSGKFRRYS